MFPIRDDNPTRHRPVLTVGFILACIGVFFFVQPLDEVESFSFLYEQAAISCEITGGAPLTDAEIESGACGAGGTEVFPDKRVPASVLTSIFLHANLLHLGANMWSLWIFGNNVEDRTRGLHYISFYLGTGVVATGVFVVMNPSATVPLIGASGAIAGVMGAYMVLFPRARVTTFVPPFFFFTFRLPAVIFLLIWFVSQFYFDTSAAGQVAWEAHVGGFVAGALYALVRRRSLR